MIFIGDLKPYCLQLDTSRAMQYKRLLEQADRYKQMELPLEHPKESTTYMGIAIANLALAYRLSGSEQYLQDAKRFMNTVLSYEMGKCPSGKCRFIRVLDIVWPFSTTG